MICLILILGRHAFEILCTQWTASHHRLRYLILVLILDTLNRMREYRILSMSPYIIGHYKQNKLQLSHSNEIHLIFVFNLYR